MVGTGSVPWANVLSAHCYGLFLVEKCHFHMATDKQMSSDGAVAII